MHGRRLQSSLDSQYGFSARLRGNMDGGFVALFEPYLEIRPAPPLPKHLKISILLFLSTQKVFPLFLVVYDYVGSVPGASGKRRRVSCANAPPCSSWSRKPQTQQSHLGNPDVIMLKPGMWLCMHDSGMVATKGQNSIYHCHSRGTVDGGNLAPP